MIYILENDQLKVKVSSLGAELQSIYSPETDTEYLWQGDDQYWGRRASNLFPVCGRLSGGAYRYEGKNYEMGSHGFARNMDWSVVRQTVDALTLQLTPTEETLAQYPFRFVLEMTYTLEANHLSVTTIVRNEDDKEMPFAVGGHPGFNVPLAEGETFEDYRLCFDEPCKPQWLDLNPDTCFWTGEMKDLPLIEDQVLPLSPSLFDGDAIFLKGAATGVALCSQVSNRQVHLSYPDSPYIGFWHTPKTEAPFLCIEPWVGCPAAAVGVEDIMEKSDMVHIQPNEGYRNTYVITLE